MSKELEKKSKATLECRIDEGEAAAFRKYAEECGSSVQELLAGFIHNFLLSDGDPFQSAMQQNQWLAAVITQRDEEMKTIKELAKVYEDRALRAESLIRKFVLES